MTLSHNPHHPFRLLASVGAEIHGLVESERLFADVVALLAKRFPENRVQLWTVGESAHSPLALAADSSGAGSARVSSLAPSDPVLAYVFQKRQSLYLNEIPDEVRKATGVLDVGTRSVLALPIQAGESLRAILVVEARAESIDADAAVLWEGLAAQVAALIANHAAFGEEKRQNSRLQNALHENARDLSELRARIAEQQTSLHRENRVLRTIVEKEQSHEIIGRSAAMLETIALADRVAPTTATVLILGESGTGKELVANRIHKQSARKDRPFVTVNCAALQESLLESELFGHEKGSFTGAIQQKLGLCETADGGTLFLDEIGEMASGIQTKLLRFLQEGEFYRIGGKKPIRVDVRVVSATNRDLGDEVRGGRFREDLYYRMNTITLRMPPLRARREDIPLLCAHFLGSARFGGVSTQKALDPKVLELFAEYGWPGNIRELQNTIERMKILSDGPQIRVEDVPFSIRAPKPVLGSDAESDMGMSIDQIEKNHILRTLAFHSGNKTKTAGTLGITIKTLYNKLHRYGLPSAGETATENENPNR